MATSPIDAQLQDPDQIDRFSNLPETLLISILSLLPTRIAARTSVLSRHFRYLWKAFPSVDLPITHPPSFNHLPYVAMDNSALLSRTSSNPLPRLHLQVGSPISCELNDSFICSLLVHAHALGLRHLTIDGYWQFEAAIRDVFSISSLESLSIRIIRRMTFPSAIALTCLKSLSINLTTYNKTQIEQLLSELCCLEDLQLYVASGCLPVLPNIPLNVKNRRILEDIRCIHGEIPFLRKAVVILRGLRPNHVTVVAQFLNFISHVEELSLNLKEHEEEDYPFPVLLEPGKKVPTFPNLKHLDMSKCFHEYNFEAVVTMLRHSTALESLKQ